MLCSDVFLFSEVVLVFVVEAILKNTRELWMGVRVVTDKSQMEGDSISGRACLLQVFSEMEGSELSRNSCPPCPLKNRGPRSGAVTLNCGGANQL